MNFKIGAFGYGLAAILGAGAVLLALFSNPAWTTFMWAAIGVFVLSIALRRA